MECYVEEKDIWSKEENCSLSNPEVVLSPPLLAQTKDKKTVEKGRMVNTHVAVGYFSMFGVSFTVSLVLKSVQAASTEQACPSLQLFNVKMNFLVFP